MMKKLGVSLVLVMFCAMMFGAASANDKSRAKNVTITEDVLVNDTLVKKGEYRVKFDAAANEVLIMKDGELVVKSKATVEMRDKKAPYNSLSFVNDSKGKKLSGITFEGDRRMIVVGETTSMPAGEGR